MPVLGLVRSPSVEHALAACELVTEHGGLGHTSAVYATDEAVIAALRRAHPHRPHPRQRADRGRRARRRLQLDDADLLARLRHLGRLDRRPTTSTTATCSTSRPSRAARRPPSGSACRRTPTSTPGAIDSLRQLRATPGDARDRPRRREPRRGRGGARAPRRRRRARVLRHRARAGRGPGARRRQGARRAAPRPADRRRRRLGDRRREGDAPVPREPRAVARRADAAVPRRPQARGPLPGDRPLGAARRGADHRRHRVGGLAGRRADRRRAQGDARRLLARARHGGRGPAPHASPCRRC